MTTAITKSPSRSSHAPLSRLTFGGILRSEWIKLWSLRSTFWCYLLIVVLNVGFAALIALNNLSGGDPTRGPARAAAGETGMAAAVTAVTLGINFTGLIAAVLGALMITGEYGTGMIKSTFTADPKRLGAFFGKAIVFGVVTFVLGFVSLIVSALAAAPLLSNNSKITLDWGNGHLWLALVGGAGYLALAGLIAYGFGAIIRASAGGISAAIGLLFVVPIVMQVVSGLTQAKWAANVTQFLPSSAGGKMFAYGSGTSGVKDGLLTLDQTQGFLVLVAWVTVSLVVALILVKRRDA